MLKGERKERGERGKRLSASDVSLCFYLKPAAGDNLQMRLIQLRPGLRSPFQDSTANCKKLVK